MVLHVAENVVVDVAVEVDFGLDAPVVLNVFEGRMFVEDAAVPSTHLVVGHFVRVLHVVFFEDFGRFDKEIVRDPGGRVPVLFGYLFCILSGHVGKGEEGRLSYHSTPSLSSLRSSFS